MPPWYDQTCGHTEHVHAHFPSPVFPFITVFSFPPQPAVRKTALYDTGTHPWSLWLVSAVALFHPLLPGPLCDSGAHPQSVSSFSLPFKSSWRPRETVSAPRRFRRHAISAPNYRAPQEANPSYVLTLPTTQLRPQTFRSHDTRCNRPIIHQPPSRSFLTLRKLRHTPPQHATHRHTPSYIASPYHRRTFTHSNSPLRQPIPPPLSSTGHNRP